MAKKALLPASQVKMVRTLRRFSALRPGFRGQEDPVTNVIAANQVVDRTVASKQTNWHQYATGLAPIVILYFVLAFYRIDDQSLWTDEVFSVNSMFPRGQAWNTMYHISPVYFVFLGLWSELVGTTEFALRALSAVLGAGAVCLTYLIGYKLFNRRTAVFAAILIATSPYLIWYAQEVRYYSLTLMASLMMTYSFHRAISGGSWYWWLAYGATSLLGLFSLVTVIFLLGAHGLYVLCCARNRALLRKVLAYQIPVLLVFAAFVIWSGGRSDRPLTALLSKRPTITWHESTRSREVLPIADLAGIVPYTFYAFSVGFSLGPSVRELQVSRSLGSLASHTRTLVPVGLLFATVVALGVKKLWQKRDTRMFVLLWLSVPILGTYLLATLTTFHEYNTRYVVMSLPAYILILAAGIAALPRSRIRLALLASVLIANGLSLANYYFDPHYAREDARSTAEYLKSETSARDVILINGNLPALKYYFKSGLPLIPIDSQTTENELLVTAKLREVNKNSDRIWLVEMRSWETDPKRNVKATLEKLARRVKHKSFPGVEVYLYKIGLPRS
jgi:4-amino-4-deoxy-L-arabinose transferase-like glycosyltransferase